MKNTFVDDSQYIMHRSHKYIKKVWKNGRWRYYYKDKNIKFLDNAAAKIGLNAETKWYEANQAYNKAFRERETYKSARNRGLGSSQVMIRRNQNYEKAVETYNKAYVQYRSTPIGKYNKIFSQDINSGKSFVKSVIDNIKNKTWEVSAPKRKAPFKVSTNNALRATRRVETVIAPSDKLYKK